MLIVPIALSLKGLRLPLLEKKLEEALAAHIAPQFMSLVERESFLKDHIEPALFRELAQRDHSHENTSYSTKLIGWVEIRDNDIDRTESMTRYMPFRTGALATKLKYVASPTEIVVLAPYAKYQYYGVAMVNAKTGKGPINIPGVGLRYKKGTVLKPTSRPLNYDRGKNPLAGPYWDRAMIAAEGSAMTAEMQRYINTRGNTK